MSDADERIELYKVVVATVTAAEQRRHTLSAFYTSLIVASIAYGGSEASIEPFWVGSMVLLVSVVWLLTVRYFRRLAFAKFKVIEALEQHFSIKPFDLEWRHFCTTISKHGNERRLRWIPLITLTHFEQCLPVLAMVASVVYLVRHLAA